jgi:SAM-dependent methyltransferase
MNMTSNNTTAAPTRWFEDEDFWMEQRHLMFHKNRLRFSFLEARKVINLAMVPPGAALLDLCCGLGRHAIEFAKQGFRVTGVDITQSYLDFARDKALASNIELELINADILVFNKPASFDLIVNLFNSFGYFEKHADNVQVLQHCFASLKPGGKLLMELYSKEVVALHFKEGYSFEQDDYSINVQQLIKNNWSWIECNWTVIKDGMEKALSYSHWLYSASELKDMLTTCGFENISFYGNLAGIPFDQKAETLVIVAEKAAS